MDLWGLNIYTECEKRVTNYYNKIFKAETVDEKVCLLNELYRYMKLVIPEFYIDGKMSYYYKKLKNLVLKCESLLEGYFLVSNNPIYKAVSSPLISLQNYIEILDYIVYETRKYLLLINNSYDLSKEHLANCCTMSNGKVLSFLDYLGLEDCSYSIVITPGFVDYPQLFDGSGYHCITILNLGERYYLIDCTYSQFFTVSHNSLERLGLVDFMNCKLGKFMTMTEERLSVANELLTRGWIEIDEKRFKNYLDGFSLYYRNGLYYEITKDYSYTTDYTAMDYYNFLTHSDSQLNHEKEYTLGYQRVPSIKYL